MIPINGQTLPLGVSRRPVIALLLRAWLTAFSFRYLRPTPTSFPIELFIKPDRIKYSCSFNFRFIFLPPSDYSLPTLLLLLLLLLLFLLFAVVAFLTSLGYVYFPGETIFNNKSDWLLSVWFGTANLILSVFSSHFFFSLVLFPGRIALNWLGRLFE